VARLSFLAATLGTLLLAPAALGQESSEQVHGTGGASAQGRISGGGSLPFTGLDFVLLVGGGLVLLAFGLAIRRLRWEKA
jgi:hypothetical protein